MKIPKHLDPTIVTSLGKVLHQGNGNDGVVIVESNSENSKHMPILRIDEVSDDSVVNFFLEVPILSAVRMSDDQPMKSGNTQWEILMNRKDLKPIEKE